MCGRFCRPFPFPVLRQEKKERKTSAKLAIYLLPEVPDAERAAEMQACEPYVWIEALHSVRREILSENDLKKEIIG